jgi:hypothetical protein
VASANVTTSRFELIVGREKERRGGKGGDSCRRVTELICNSKKQLFRQIRNIFEIDDDHDDKDDGWRRG